MRGTKKPRGIIEVVGCWWGGEHFFIELKIKLLIVLMLLFILKKTVIVLNLFVEMMEFFSIYY